MSKDDIAIPDFLKRVGKLSDDQLKRLLAPHTPASVTATTRKSPMAKLNAAVDNPAAPVRVMMRDPSDNIHERSFANLAEFQTWYNPKQHKFLGTTNNKDVTLITLDVTSVEDVAKKLTPEPKAPKVKAPPAPGAKVHHRVKYKGKEYKSLEVIWRELDLPMSKIRKFRVELKAAKKLAYEKHEFEIVETAH